ncbi:exopolysaccharide production protein ExoQ [Devosia lucknowensis]|uniref:Exopolysaccharide production protein ExoQ n=1 Tax=Devosia lucknowensis TaxID=1096929 RepID=A0A1Y6FM63_9HYPH|nr:O-antigen ligase family protein [Devosia lucknowensis]SMQ76008.1 exopolysaccharide production protein ExoQ [Devosia lucknowensis]
MTGRLQFNLATMLTFGAFSALVLNAMFGPRAALVFMACGALLIVSNMPQSIDSVKRWWPILLLPAWCLLTALWSLYPSNSIRYSIQLGFTVVVAMVMTGRVSTTTLMRLMFVVYGIGVVASIAFGRTGSFGAWLGVFGSKNAFAAHIAVFMLIAMAITADRHSHLLVRLCGVIGFGVSVPMLILAQSAGAIMMVAPCVGIIVLTILIVRLTGPQKLFLFALLGLGLAALALLFATMGNVLLADILEGSGKDATLTGRTDLWTIGLNYIAERPLQGLGYRSFWVVGFAPAEELWAMFLVPSGAGFNFHNTYISNAVEIGMIGLGLQVIIIYGGALTMAAYTIARPNAPNALLLSLQVLMILRSFIEVEVFFEFSIRSIMGVATLIYGAQGLLALRRNAPRPARPRPRGLLSHVRVPVRPRSHTHAHLQAP